MKEMSLSSFTTLYCLSFLNVTNCYEMQQCSKLRTPTNVMCKTKSLNRKPIYYLPFRDVALACSKLSCMQ